MNDRYAFWICMALSSALVICGAMLLFSGNGPENSRVPVRKQDKMNVAGPSAAADRIGPESAKSAARLAVLFLTIPFPQPARQQAPRPSEAPVAVAEDSSWLRFIGYMTAQDGKPMYFLKDTRENVLLKLGKEKDTDGNAVLADNPESITVLYKGKTYETEKK